MKAFLHTPSPRGTKAEIRHGSPVDCRAPLAMTCSPLAYTTGGAGNWAPDLGGYYGYDSARSPELALGQESWLQTTVEGEGTFSFWAMISQAGVGNELKFYVGDTLRYGCESEEWEQFSWEVTGTGTHTLKWVYQRNSQNYAGAGYVDCVEWDGYLPLPPAQSEPDPEDWKILTYVYDAAGRRIEKKYDGDTIVQYVYDGDHCLAEYNGYGQLLRKYIYGPGVDQPICMIDSMTSPAVTSYYHFDGLGSVVALTDDEGDTVQVYEYDVYGRVGATDASHPNRIMFTGREYDRETGLYYYRARDYNPQIGRFLQTDPVGYGAGLNLYRYCLNNPVGYTDPSGAYPGEANGVSFWGATHPPTNGAQYGDSDAFELSSSDWVNSFSMSSALDVLSTLSSLRDVGADLSQIYFQEHADPTNFTKITNPITGTTSILGSGGITGMEFGNDIIQIDESETFWKELGALLPEGATINFRSCWAGEDPCVLIKLAKLTGHPVTGCTGTVSDLGKDVTGPNYTLDGDLRRANPDGTWSTVWTPTVLPEGRSTQFPAIPVQVPNPVPQPY
jgi:RHS repeat-associated protein